MQRHLQVALLPGLYILLPQYAEARLCTTKPDHGGCLYARHIASPVWARYLEQGRVNCTGAASVSFICDTGCVVWGVGERSGKIQAGSRGLAWSQCMTSYFGLPSLLLFPCLCLEPFLAAHSEPTSPLCNSGGATCFCVSASGARPGSNSKLSAQRPSCKAAWKELTCRGCISTPCMHAVRTEPCMK